MTKEAPNLRTFEGWALVSARLRGQSHDAQVAILSSLGILAGWPELDQYWRAVLVEDIATGGETRPQHYRQVCYAAQSAAQAPGPGPQPSLGPHGGSEPAPQSVPTPTSSASPASARPTIDPTPVSAPPAIVAQPLPATPISTKQVPLAQAPQSASPWGNAHPQMPPSERVVTEAPGKGSRTMGFAAPAVSVIGAPEDFRQQLMSDVNEGSGAPSTSSPVAAGGSFVHHLAPSAPSLVAPTAGQASTSGIGSDSAEAALAATEAVRWPVEQYAQVSAAVEKEPYRQQLIWAEHGVTGKHLVRVLKRWAKKFQDDPELEATWRQLVDDHLGK